MPADSLPLRLRLGLTDGPSDAAAFHTTTPPAEPTPQPAPPVLMLDIAGVAKSLTLSESSVRRLIAEGRFPPPRKCGRSARWHIDDVRAAAAAL